MRDPKAEVLEVLRSLPGRLYAVLDAAKDPEVLQLLRRSGYQYECLYSGWVREVYGEAAPYLVELRKHGMLLKQLIERGWGKGWGVYGNSATRFKETYASLRRLVYIECENGTILAIRFFDMPAMQNKQRDLPPDSLVFNSIFTTSVHEGSDGQPICQTRQHNHS